MGSLINLAQKRRERRERVVPKVRIDIENDTFVFRQHRHEEVAHRFGTPKPPVPSISHLGGFIVTENDEIEFPPPAC
jgi:hypothetical protein